MIDSPQVEPPNRPPPTTGTWRWAAALAGLLPALASAVGAASIAPSLRAAADHGIALRFLAVHRFVIAAGALATGIALSLAVLFFRRSLAASRVPDLPYSIAVVVLALLSLSSLWRAESHLFSIVFAGWGPPFSGSISEIGPRQSALVTATLLVSGIAAVSSLITPIVMTVERQRPMQHGASRTLALVWLIATLLFGAATAAYSVRSSQLRDQAPIERSARPSLIPSSLAQTRTGVGIPGGVTMRAQAPFFRSPLAYQSYRE